MPFRAIRTSTDPPAHPTDALLTDVNPKPRSPTPRRATATPRARVRTPGPFGALTALAGLTLPLLATAQQGDVPLDAIEAVVNEGVVLASEVRAESRFLVSQAATEGQPLPEGDVLRERVLDRLIDQEVRRQHARRLGVSIDAGSVNRAIEQVAAGNNLSVARFRDTLRSQGLDYDRYRYSIEQELLLQRLVQRDVESRIRVSEREIDDFVDALDNDASERRRYRVGHILIAVPPSADVARRDAAVAKAQDLLARLRAGATFENVAAAESDGSRALDGGDLGYRTLQEFPGFMAEALGGMEAGDLAGPLESPNGLHVIRLHDVRDSDPRERDETLVRHLFFEDTGADAAASAAVLARADTALRRLRSGEPFAAVAAQVSEDPNSRDNGGELPWFSDGEMPNELEAMAATLAPGRVSEPFRTRFGYHVLEVLERRSRRLDDDIVRERATDAIRQRRVEQEAERWMLKLRDESFVDIRAARPAPDPESGS